MSLGENIKNKRQELKLSQEYLADQLGVSRQAVSKWETGQSEPTASNLVKLAAVFEISLSELVDPQRNDEGQVRREQENRQQQTKLILWTNLSLLALTFQAGVLSSCTHIVYTVEEGQRVPDYRFALIKTALLFLCSLWMARNLMYETNLAQRKKNSWIELAYCCVQLVIAYVTYRFTLGLMGSLLILAVLLVYVLCINPKYMNRPFGKKLLADKRLQ